MLAACHVLTVSIVPSAVAHSEGTALVRHAPSINGTVEGSVQQMMPESVTINGSAVVTGDLLVPGMPSVRLNGRPTFSGVVDLDGPASPTNHRVTLNGACSLRNVVRRVEGFALPVVAVPARPPGARNVTIIRADEAVGDWGTVRDLTLNGGVGERLIPPGRYGTFTANGGTGFVLGVPGGVEPAVYEFQSLNLNGLARLAVQGPVIVTVARGFAANGSVGAQGMPAWLELRIASGGFTLNGGCTVHGYITAPAGTVIINGSSELVGGVVSDRLTVNGNGALRLMDRGGGNQAPTAIATSAETDMDTPVSIPLAGQDPEGASLVFSISEPPQHGGVVLSGSMAVYTPAIGFVGTDAFHFCVSDGELQSAPAVVAVTVRALPDPPVGRRDGYFTHEDSSLVVTAPGVLVNDDNPSGAALTGELQAAPTLGTVEFAPDGGFTFQPLPGVYGSDRFFYRPISAGVAGGNTEVVIQINAKPRVTSGSITTLQNKAAPVPLVAVDPDSESLILAIASEPVHGLLLGTIETGLTYQPSVGFSGDDAFSFTATDASGASATGLMGIRVLPTGIGPVARIKATCSDTSAPFEVIFDGSASSDADGSVVRYQWDFDGDGLVDDEGASVVHHFTRGGEYRVTLTVTDDASFSASESTRVRLNLEPSVAIRSPAALSSLVHGSDVLVQVDSHDPDGFVAKVDVFVDGESAGEAQLADGRLVIPDLAVGSHLIVARATDDSGVSVDSAPVAVRIVPSLAEAGNFIVHPDLRVASLAAVPAPDEGGVGIENTTSLALLADNFHSASVDYQIATTGDGAGGFSGYLVHDSAASADVVYHWEDISQSGRKLDIANVDDGFESVPLSFDFWFYDRRFGAVIVGTNGILTFDEGSSRRYPESIPSASAPRYMLAPFWTDLLPGYQAAGGGSYGGGWSEPSAIYVRDFGDRLVVQYSADAQFFGQAPDPENGTGMGVSSYNLDGTYTFQVVLHQSGDIDFVYRVMSGVTWNATIGLQGGDVQDAIQLAYCSEFVTDHRTIRFAGTPVADKWFTIDRDSGSLAHGESDVWTITYHSKPGFPAGFYRGRIRVDHTQAGLDPYLIDVGLEIFRTDPVVEFVEPRSDRRRYSVLGEPVVLRLDASDGDGLVRHVSVFDGPSLLAEWASGPFRLEWSPPAGLHTLTAQAIDNDGRTGEAAPLELSVSDDSDDDGLPDAWELDHLGSLEQSGEDDADYDTRTNKREYFLGSFPVAYDHEPVGNEPPVAHIEYSAPPAEAPFRVGFDARGSFDPDGRIWFFQWDFDDDGEWDAFEPYVEHVFSSEGTHRVRLMVGDSDYAYAHAFVDVRVRAASSNAPPIAAFSASSYAGPAARTIDFDASASTDDIEIVSFEWTFGDGYSASGPLVSHHFDRVGLYPIQLTVTDSEGASSRATKYVTITHRDQTAFVERNGFLAAEAEHATTLDPRADLHGWMLHRPTVASETWGVALQRNDGGYLPGPEPADTEIEWAGAAEVSWKVVVQTPGVYYLAVRYATGTLDTQGTLALRVGVDGVELSPPEGNPLGHSFEPIWRRTVSLGYLSRGAHEIQIRRHRDLVWLDQIAIALDKARLPADAVISGPLPTATRPGLAPLPPVARMAPLPETASIPFDLTLDSSTSSASRGLAIVAQNWRLNRALDPVDGSLRARPAVVSTSPIASIEVDALGAAVAELVASDSIEVELTVVDSQGRIDTTAKRLSLVDPLEVLTEQIGIVVDDESDAFSAPADWQATGPEGAFINGGYFAGGVTQFLDSVGKLPTDPRAAVSTFPVRLDRLIGEHAHLDFNYEGSPTDEARFVLPAGTAGRHMVFVRWPRHHQSNADGFLDGASDLPATVVHPPVSMQARVAVRTSSGESIYLVNQRQSGGHWYALGVHEFDAATPGWVSIASARAGEMVFADAIKLVPVASDGASPTATMTALAGDDRTVQFDGRDSSDAAGEIVAWFWEFGDGHTSRGRHPRHHYETPGTYEVRLTVIDDTLNTHSVTQAVTLAEMPESPPPVARYMVSAIRGRVPFAFHGDAAASVSDGPMESYQWRTTLRDEPWNGSSEFSAFGPQATFVFNAPGVYPVTVTVRDRFGREDTASFMVEAVADGISTWAPLVVDNRASSVSWTGPWTKSVGGPGFIDADHDPTHFEQAARDFTGPDFQTAGGVGSGVTFRASLATSGLYQVALRYPSGTHDTPLSVRVDHGGGPSWVTLNHSVEPGEWHLLGTFSFLQGAPAAVSFTKERPLQDVFADAVRWVPVGAGTRSDFSITAPADSTVPARFAFDGTLSTSDTNIVGYAWDFGDGTVGAGSGVEDIYETPGMYVVTLTVLDDRGGSAVSSRLIKVRPSSSPPHVVASVSPLSGHAGLVIRFDASASEDADGIASYAWDFGDGTTSPAAIGYHRYDRPGAYTATVTVTDAFGAEGATSVTIQVEADPSGGTTPRLDFDRSPNGEYAVAGVGAGAQVTWDFGDGSTASGGLVTHAYAADGIYLVTASITENGRTYELSRWIVVGSPTSPGGEPRSDAGARFLLYTPLAPLP